MLNRKTKYKRWLEFSLNLANVLDITPKRKERLKNEIKSFITLYSPEGYNTNTNKPILGWDATVEADLCIGSHADEFFSKYEVWNPKSEEYTGKFHNQLLSCIRAGLDVAVPDMNGGGVLGFTVGDIRKAYNNDIPKWLNKVLKLKGDEPADTGLWL